MSCEEEIAQYIVRTFAPDVAAESLSPQLDLLGTGIVSSLGLLRLIAWLEERYRVPVSEMSVSVENFGSIGAIASLVRDGSDLVRRP